MQDRPIRLLTAREISRLTKTPYSEVRALLDEHPEFEVVAEADGKAVYDGAVLAKVMQLLQQKASR
jgi:hypothetical protein